MARPPAFGAAAGRDDQATGAWQTSLIDGSDFPEIYAWLADALMREVEQWIESEMHRLDPEAYAPAA